MKRLVLLVLVSTACSSPLTADRLSPSVGEGFGGAFTRQQQLLGRTDVGDLHVLSTCRRTGTSPQGAGEDWLCTVQYDDLGTAGAQSFEVQLKPDGCWTAAGPPAVQPAQLVDAQSGARVANPLAVWDGCVDTSLR